MKKFAALLLFFSVLSSAQNQRFIYDYSFLRDTLNKDNISKELMYLDVSKDGSKFYSRDAFVADSTRVAYYEKQIQATGAMNVSLTVRPRNSGIITYKVFKDFPKQEISLETRIGGDLFNVADDRKMVWKILPEKMKIGEFETQKATTTFAGRNWTAYFSAELPFQDGPYKFSGLPGLIVKMEDASKTHQFELKGVTKFTPSKPKISEFNQEVTPIRITQEKYKKLFWEMRNDPAKDFKQMIVKGNIGNMKDGNGAAISPTEFIKRTENSAKEKQAKNNNLIEIDMLKP